MRSYRIYSLNAQGHICLAHEFQCRDDLDALAEGERLSDKSDVEVREGGRLVARVKCGNAPLDERDHQSL